MAGSAERVREFEQALLSLDRLAAHDVLAESDDVGDPIELVERVVVPALERIGTGWEEGRVALSQVYMGGRICEQLVDDLLPPGGPDRRSQPKMAIAVLEDYHLLGERIVRSVLRASGFELLDYGRMTVDELVDRVREDGVEVLLISTLMLPSALRVGDVRARLDGSGAKVRIVVGGAPFRFDDRLWREVGADAMGRTASDVVDIVAAISGGVS